ncbi:MAG TPA: hypothetical protein VFQ78_14445 [Candidatus Udaeobacter sp.]|jgi:hypothetical protein|nr:hypothetical protein [Candidatus Udaeobacter sp.]
MKTNILYSLLILLFLCFAALSGTQAISPPPDGCYPNFTTAEGCGALNSLTTGAGNSGLGWYALFGTDAGNFNTGVGAGALTLNNADSNTAVGTAALLLNTAGLDNTAVGTNALVNNDGSAGLDAGSFNAAFGSVTLSANLQGLGNVAIGHSALSNSDSNYNTAVGLDAGENLVGAGFDENIYIGDTAGTLDFTGAEVGNESGVIRIGSFFSGTAACFINGILPNFVTPAPGNAIVTINTITGQLGWTTDSAANKVVEQQKQIERQQASINQLKTEMQTMVVQLKEQATQIQRVSAQLELSKAAPRTVRNNQ